MLDSVLDTLDGVFDWLIDHAVAVIVAVALVAAGLIGWKALHPHETYKGPGIVESVSYDDPDDVWIPPVIVPGSTHCSTIGKSTSCYTTGPTVIPGYMAHDGPHWRVKIRSGDGKHHTLSIPEALYQTCQVGMRWTYGKGCTLG